MMGFLLLCRDLTFQSRPRFNIPSARSKCRPWCHGPGKSLSHRRIGPGCWSHGISHLDPGCFCCVVLLWLGEESICLWWFVLCNFTKEYLIFLWSRQHANIMQSYGETVSNSPLSVKATCACFDGPWVCFFWILHMSAIQKWWYS